MKRRSFVLTGLAGTALALGLPKAFAGEAPDLAAKVTDGSLPALADRLPVPEDIMVLEPVEAVGQYGGTLRVMHANPTMDELRQIVNDPGVRWNRDFTDYAPGAFKSWSFNADGSEITFQMRRGMKWSDGADFTSDDLAYYWNDLAGNKDFGDVPLPYWGFTGKEFTTTLIVNDPYSFTVKFAQPNWNFPYLLANGYAGFDPMMTPKHYLSQFDPNYNKAVTGYDQLRDHLHWYTTPGYPTILAWSVTTYEPGIRVVLSRNPFYWKTDSAGNQLPYIDTVISSEISDPEVQLLKVISGEIDLQARTMPNPRNVPTVIESQEKAGYRWLDGWRSGAGGWPCIIVNQTYTGGDYLRGLLQSDVFRQALSWGIDRAEINEAVWTGMGVPQQGTISQESWHFTSDAGKALLKEWQTAYADYDADKANSMLDGMGLTNKNGDGIRIGTEGNPIQLRIDISDWGVLKVNQDTADLLKEHWKRIGIDVLVNQPTQAEFDAMTRNGEFMLMTGRAGEMDLWTFPDWVFVTGNASRMFSQYSQWYATGGSGGEEPAGPGKDLHELYMKGIALQSREEREQLVQQAIRIHIDQGPFFIGIAGDVPMPCIANAKLRNIPNYAVIVPAAVGGIGTTDPTQYFYGA